MTFKMSENARTIKIFNLRADTNEFIGSGDAYIPANTGLPAYSTDITPPVIPTGKVAIFQPDKGIWDIAEDHRGETVYSIETGSPIYIDSLGPLPEKVTNLPPDGLYQKWNGITWVTDNAAMYSDKAESERQTLLNEANATIADWLIDLQLGVITDEDKSSLILWRDYSKSLKALDLSKIKNEGDYKEIMWPDKPE